jgi:hypothetical protein
MSRTGYAHEIREILDGEGRLIARDDAGQFLQKFEGEKF